MLKLILVLAVIIAILLALLAILKRLGSDSQVRQSSSANRSESVPSIAIDEPPTLAPEIKFEYRKQQFFFSKAENSFFRVLQQIAGNQYLIFAKVRLCDVVSVSKGTGNYQSLQNKIQSKHVDFLLCSTDHVKPLVVIELDDSSHDIEKRKNRDAEVDAILQSAGLPIVHVKAQHSYVPADVAARLRAVIES